ncbi:hypothetical protein H4582DRAFT_2056842 [Lactarius indigo]|nr:hypothetical protein H4582DRAFT_2056842 [Lactarius indigo]
MGSIGLPQVVWWWACRVDNSPAPSLTLEKKKKKNLSGFLECCGTCTWWTGMEQWQRRGWHGTIVLSSVAEGVGAEGRWKRRLVWPVLVADGVWASFLHTAGAVQLGKKRWSGGFCGMGRDPPCTRSTTAAAAPTSSSPQPLPPPAAQPTLALQDLTTATTPPQHCVQDPTTSNAPQCTTQYPDRQPATPPQPDAQDPATSNPTLHRPNMPRKTLPPRFKTPPLSTRHALPTLRARPRRHCRPNTAWKTPTTNPLPCRPNTVHKTQPPPQNGMQDLTTRQPSTRPPQNGAH